MKQLKEPKATEKEVKKTARVTSTEKVETETIGELLIPSIKTNRQTYCAAQQDIIAVAKLFSFRLYFVTDLTREY